MKFVVTYLYRLIRYKNQRRKFVREINIIKKQNSLLKKNYSAETKKLIIFGIPGSDWATGKDLISGGIISIVSLCEETTKIADVHKATTILATLPNQHLLLKHEQFNNNTDVFRFEQLPGFFENVEEIILHLPEFLCTFFLKYTSEKEMQWLTEKKNLHINILNQNIMLMPGVETIQQLEKLANKVTITTAHQNYCTPAYRQLYGVPLHKLSVWVSPEQYNRVTYEQKENLIVVSPDEHPMKQQVMEKLQSVKGLTCQVIKNLTYEKFKETIARAKWTLTFGEGLDGYLVEPVFSGAVGFAVYNKDFFTSDFERLATIYKSYDEMVEKIAGDINNLDQPVLFNEQQHKQFELCARYYSASTYRDNLVRFYNQQYTFP